MVILAKSNNRASKETLWQHTLQLLKRYEEFYETYGVYLDSIIWEALYLACYYHDVGKANSYLQKKLSNNTFLIPPPFASQEIAHNYISPAFMSLKDLREIYSEEAINIAIAAIYWHHKRPDADMKSLIETVQKDLPVYSKYLIEDGFQYIEGIPNLKFLRYINKKEFSHEKLISYIKVKGLLNKIDYAASGHFEMEIPHQNFSKILKRYFKEKGINPNELQAYLIEHRNEHVIAIASTGIGKTEGGLLWLGESKGIFTLPLKVSINAIYQRIINDIGYEHIGLVHSEMTGEYLKQYEEKGEADDGFDLRLVQQTKQFAEPLTITTIDQIIEFVWGHAGSELKQAVFSYSYVIIDEIQMYSPRLVAFILAGLEKIHEMGGKFLVMTATLPPIFLNRISESCKPQEIRKFYKKNSQTGKVIQRHNIKVFEQELKAINIYEKQKEHGKVLVIVNTVKKAQLLYKELKSLQPENKIQLLHSRFIQQDLSEKEEAIKVLGKKENLDKGIWITTQLVEASIDIDFDFLLTELSEMAGLLQRLGRVYRNRALQKQQPNCYIYTEGSGISKDYTKSVVDWTIYQKSKEVLLAIPEGILTEEHKMELVDEVYSEEALKESAYLNELDKTLKKLLDTKPYEEQHPPQLRDIQNEVIIPYCVYHHNQCLINTLKQELSANELTIQLRAKEALKRYIVSIPTWAYEKAKKENLIVDWIEIDRYTKYSIINFSYSKELGLSLIKPH